MVYGKILILALVLVGMAVTGAAIPSLSNSGGGSWKYYKEITVRANSGSALTDYQVLVQLSGSNFPSTARYDGADIRFTDGNGNELSYWIERWDYAGRNAKIWMKVKSISAGASAIVRMYYGDSSASSSSNGDTTFVFFDDFTGTNIDSNKWSATGSGISQNNELVINWGSWGWGHFVSSVPTFSAPLIIEFKAQATQGNDFTRGYVGYGNIETSENDYAMMFSAVSSGTPSVNGFVKNSAQSWPVWIGSTSSYVASTYYNFKLVIFLTGAELYREGMQLGNTDTSQSLNNLKIYAGTPYSGFKLDDIRVRKYAASEPTVTLGAEQPVSFPTPTITPTATTNPPEPVTSAVLLHGEKTEVVLDEDVLLKLSAVNLISNPSMSVQVILYPPSGMSVISSEFVKSGAGIYTTTYSLNPSEGKDIEVRIKTNQVGDFIVKGRIVYYFGDNKSSVEDYSLSLPIKVRKESALTQNEGTPAQKQIQGFDVIIGISGLLFVVILKKRR